MAANQSLGPYTVGQLVAILANFATPPPANTPLDPTLVTARITTPDGIVTDLSAGVLHTGPGSFVVNFLVQQLGLHQYEFIGSGTVQAAAVGRFLCNQGTF